LKSLKNQCFSNYEVLFVNDGSTDNTLEVMQSAASEFKHCKIISHDKNQGSYAARISGIKQAQNEYIYMADADDVMMPEALERMYAKARKSGADIVCMNAFASLRWGGVWKMRFTDIPTGVRYNRSQMIRTIYTDTVVYGIMWNKLYRNELFANTMPEPEPLFLGDDTILTLSAYNEATSMEFIPYYGYVYYLSGGSAKWHERRWKDNERLFCILQQRLPGLNISEAEKTEFARKYSEVFARSMVTGTAHLLFLSPWNKRKAISYLRECLSGPVWEQIRSYSYGTKDPTLIAAFAKDIDKLIELAKLRNRKNFFNEMISYIS